MNFLMIIIFLFIQLPSESNAEGDLSIRSKKLVLNLGSDKSDYDMSQKIFNMETGKAYRLEITSMWANKLVKGDIHPPHTHSNNVFSGVYYLKGGSPIQFFDPRPQASVLHPNLKYSNFDNSGMIGFNSSKGYGLIFPSWLQHWVNTTDKTRISISWNILLRGDYGQPGTLQNSHI